MEWASIDRGSLMTLSSHSQISLANARIAREIGTLQHDLAVLQHIGPIGEVKRLIGVLFDQQDCHPVLGLPFMNEVEELRCDQRREAERRFVEHQEPRPRHQRAGDHQHLLLTARERAGTLSGGEQQMLDIARALMSRPRLLMLDEPSLGLAPLITAKLLDFVHERKTKDRMTILLVEQNANQALHLADRAYVLENGEVVLQGADLASDARVREAYLGV